LACSGSNGALLIDVCSSDNQSEDCVNDDDDDYDVPPAFRHLDLSDVARLSSVVETDTSNAGDTVGYDINEDDDDDDYDVLPSVIRPFEDGSRPPSDADALDLYDDDDNYDVLPAFLPDSGDVARLSTNFESQSTASGPLSPALTDMELYDFIAPKDVSEGGWSDDVVQRTSKSDLDVENDDMYDYIGVHSDMKRQLGDHLTAGDEKDARIDSGCVDELYDYPPIRSSPEAAAHEYDSGGNCRSSVTTVLGRQQSSSSSIEHYDVLPNHPASSSDQLPVRTCSVSGSTPLSSSHAVVSDSAVYDFITPKHATAGARSDNSISALNSEAAGASEQNSAGGDCRGPATTVRKHTVSSDDHYDVFPCSQARSSDQLSVRKSSDATTGSTPLTSFPPQVAAPPSSCSTSSSSPSDHPQCDQSISRIDSEQQTVSVATRCSAVASIISDQLRFSPTASAANKPSSKSM